MLASAESLVQGIAGVVNRTSRGITALHLTALFGLTEITTELLGGHQNPNVMALQAAHRCHSLRNGVLTLLLIFHWKLVLTSIS